MYRDDAPLSDHYKSSDDPFAMQSPSSFTQRVREPKTANTTPSSDSNNDDPIFVPSKSGFPFTQVLCDTLLLKEFNMDYKYSHTTSSRRGNLMSR